MTRVNPQGFSGLKILHHQFAGEFEPCGTLPTEVLETKALTAKNAGSQRLLKSDANLNLRCAAEKAVAVHHELVAGSDFDRHNVPRELRCERQFASCPHSAIFRHEKRSAPGHATNSAKQSSTSAKLGMRGHLDRACHPRKLACLGDNRFVRFQHELKNGHRRAQNAVLHENSWSNQDNWVAKKIELILYCAPGLSASPSRKPGESLEYRQRASILLNLRLARETDSTNRRDRPRSAHAESADRRLFFFARFCPGQRQRRAQMDRTPYRSFLRDHRCR